MQIVFFNYIICIFVRLFAEKMVKITNVSENSYWLLSFTIYSKNVMKRYMTFSSKGLVNMKKKHWQIIGSLFILSRDNYLLKCCSIIMYYMRLFAEKMVKITNVSENS
jgi:hypothetical protein